MESDWPPFLSKLLGFTARRTEGRVAMYTRFSILIEHFRTLLADKRIVKVTGTNGKGSVCAMLEACLQSEGLKVGLFTSPHLFRVTERIRVAGVDVSSDTLDYYAERVVNTVQEFVSVHGESYTPSFFECLILIALHLFHDQDVDVAIFEAGVGGHNDATSLLNGEFSVITNIGLDHKEQLGDSLEAIAADKAGIASRNAHLVLGPDISQSLREVIEDDVQHRNVVVSQASYRGLSPHWLGLDHPTRIDMLIDGQLLQYELPLLGRYQVANFATVVALIRVLVQKGVVSDFQCLNGVARTRWHGRLEVRNGSPRYLIDAAHNKHGILALRDSLADLVPHSKRLLLFGASSEKDYKAYLPHLSELAPEIYLVEGFYRSEQGKILAEAMPEDCNWLRIFPSPRAAAEFLETSPLHKDKVVIAAGSIFMIGELMNSLDLLRIPTNQILTDPESK
jgi:dihydrofolate synthase / folylpolyglutamate synthase